MKIEGGERALLKKIMASILVAMTMMMMGGCSVEQLKAEKIKNDVENYLEDKYNEEFTVISIQGKEWLSSANVEKLYVYPSDGDRDNDKFEVKRTKTEAGYEYADTYFGLLIEDEYNSRIASLVGKYFDSFEVKSTFDNPYFSNEYDETKTLQDAIDGGEDLYSTVGILVAPTCTEDEFNEKVEEISNEIGNLGFPMGLAIYYSNSDDLNSIYTNNIEYSIYRYMLILRDSSVELDEEIY